MNAVLLTRDQFRELVFARDKHTCVHCGKPGVDAHHIMERRLFEDGGYYLENGVTLCPDCHLGAEDTTIAPDTLRLDAGITDEAGNPRALLPPHLEEGTYDKWANPVLPNGQRLIGELFHEPGVQRALRNHLYLFTDKVKYPKTLHWPSSPGLQNDDRVHTTIDQWNGLEVVVTEKLDGENTTMTRNYMHARSLEFSSHPSRAFIKAIWSRVAHDIPENFRVCGENVTAIHSIEYSGLDSYFYVFNIWQGQNCLSWDETSEYASLLDLPTVPVLYRGEWEEGLIDRIAGSLVPERQEGLVFRPTRGFTLREFPRLMAKWVRKGHVQTNEHWMNQPVRFNGLKNNTNGVSI